VTGHSLKVVTVTFDPDEECLSIDGWGMSDFEILGMLDAAIRTKRTDTEFAVLETSDEEEA